MTWKKVKIKDIFDFEKWPLQSSKNNPWKYDFITASSERKTHDTFSHEWEHLIFAMAASGSLWRTHYVNWKFISSDLCFILTPKERNSINMKFYHIYFNLIKKDIVSKTATWSAKIAINQNNFWNYEIIVWDIKEQDRIFDKINSLAPNIEKLLNILEDQDLVKRLRQSILQDAIQGKLVPQDPNDEPASELLKRIKAEKEQLIKEKKIKKPKDLAPITDDEIPFTLPKGWEWVRLGEISYLITDGTHHTPTYVDNWIPFLSVKDVAHGSINFSNTRFISEQEHKELIKRCNPEFWDILLTKVWTTWIAKIIDTKKEFSIFVSIALIKFFKNEIYGKYLEHLINSPYVKNLSEKWTEWVWNKNLVLRKIVDFVLPLPPLAEQHRIVAKVDELMKFCDWLEKQITEAKENGEKLMESVLGEVFR